MTRVLGEIVGADGARVRERTAEIVVAAVLKRGKLVRVGWVSNSMKQKARDACGKGNLHFEEGHVRLAPEARVDLWEIWEAWDALTRLAEQSPPDVERLTQALTECRRLLDGSYFDVELAPTVDDLRIGVDAELSDPDPGYFSRMREAHATKQLERLEQAAGVAHALADDEAKWHFYYKLRELEPDLPDVARAPAVLDAFQADDAILRAGPHHTLRAAAERHRIRTDPTAHERIEARYRASAVRIVGRDDELARVADQLDSGLGGDEGAVVVLHGPVGIGKGAVADALARQKVDAGWSVVRRLRVGARGGLETELPGLARDLGWSSPTAGADDQQRAVDWLRAELPRLSPWLLVVEGEGVPRPETLDPLLPCPSGGAILVVTRHPTWAGVSQAVNEIAAHPPAAAQELFAEWADVPMTPELADLCEAYGNRVGDLQALASDVRRGAATVGELLEDFRSGRDGHASKRIEALLSGVEATPGMRGLLDVVAVVDREDIPLTLLVDVAPEFSRLRLVRTAIADLESMRLVVRSAADGDRRWSDRFSIHAEEHAVMADRLEGRRRDRAVQSAANALLRAMPEWPLDASGGARGAALVRHADALAHRTRVWSDELQLETRIRVAFVLRRVADYRRWVSDWEEAQRDLRLAVALGADDPDPVGQARRELALGNLLRKRGKLASQPDGPGAEDLIQRAVAEITARSRDPLEIARAQTVQARLHRVCGELHDALDLLNRAVPVLQGEHGSSTLVTDRELADSYSWLAGVCRRLGRREHAAVWIERALARVGVTADDVRAGRFDRVTPTRQALKHLRTFGTIERASGRVLVSLEIHRFVLASRIAELGTDHHLVAVSHLEVARDELTIGRLEAATHHAREADRISLERCGQTYPHRGTAQVLLAIVDRERGEFDSARHRLLSASSVFDARARTDPRKEIDHLDFAVDVGDCALMLAVENVRHRLAQSEAADPASAREIVESALEEVEDRRRIRAETLGREHPHLATCDSARGEIARVLWSASLRGEKLADTAGDTARAAAWHELVREASEQAHISHSEALQKREATLEISDPNIAWTLEQLGNIEAQLGEIRSARGRWRRSADLRVEALGLDSPLTRRVTDRLSRSGG